MKTKIKFSPVRDQTKLFPMRLMKPGEICKVNDPTDKSIDGHIVMRTLSTRQFEVMDLSVFEEDECWTNNNCNVMVEPYHGEIIFQREE